MHYLLFLLLLLPGCLSAQTDGPVIDEPVHLFPQEQQDGPATDYTSPTRPPVVMRSVPAERWAEASKGLDYSDDLPKPPKTEKPRRTYNPNFLNWTAATQGLGSILQVLAILLAVGLIGYGVYRMMQAPRNKIISRDGVEITVDNLDQYIQETDLERFLREALAQGNYSLAVRLYYLQIIKDLSAKDAIRWSREKTNRDYQREMRTHRLAEDFRLVTLHFEEVWYGNQALDAATYSRLEPEFKRLIGEIGGG